MSGISDFVQIAAVLIAAASIAITSRSQRRSQDVAVVISLGNDYRDRWDRAGREAVESMESRGAQLVDTSSADATPDDAVVLSLLNWIDWLGVLIRRKAFHDADLVLGTVGPSMGRVLSLASRKVEADCAEKGAAHWSGVLEVAHRLIEEGSLPAAAFPVARRRRHPG